MIRLLYCSQAKPEFNTDTLEEILLTSRKNNSAAGITGVLVHGGGMFMQTLEGPEQAVLRTYENSGRQKALRQQNHLHHACQGTTVSQLDHGCD